MSKMPRVTGAHVVRSLEKVGFSAIRKRGSHVIMRHADGRTTVIPVHGNETIGIGLMSKIQKDIGLGREPFIDLFQS